jgi:hypothetical protein
MGILDGSLAQSIYDGFKGQLLTATYRERVVPDSGGTDELGDPQDVADVEHDCEGFVDLYSATTRAQAGIPATDLQLNIFAKSMDGVVPQRDGIFEITGPVGSIYLGKWYQVRNRDVDPAGALWQLQSFEIKAPTP